MVSTGTKATVEGISLGDDWPCSAGDWAGL